ncbi:YLP motif-containing protein 1-like [Cloeon dipterum]|uniref:YLP motif-containing protein 1-like n=1 Tax=Cloeon dipterum TaxID=197152 RepID=UPI0032200067
MTYRGQYSGLGAPQMKQPPPYSPFWKAGVVVPPMMMRPAEAATGRPRQQHAQQIPRYLAGQQPQKQNHQPPPYNNPSWWAGGAVPPMMMRPAEAATGRPRQHALQIPCHPAGQQLQKQTHQPPPYNNPSWRAERAVPPMMMRPAEAATGMPSQQLAQQLLFVKVRVEPQFPSHPDGQQSQKLPGVGIIEPTPSLGLSLPSPIRLPEPSYDVMSPHLCMLDALVSSFPVPKTDVPSQQTRGGGRGQLRTASSFRPLRNSKLHFQKIKVEEVTPERRPWPYPSVKRSSWKAA